jgi:hypothetical protein
MSNGKTWLGRVSLWTAIAGVIVPVCLVVLLVIWVLLFVPQGRVGPSGEDAQRMIVGLVLCGVAFVVLELVALGCGLAARCTATGRVGLAIAGALLTLALGVTTGVLHRADFW